MRHFRDCCPTSVVDTATLETVETLTVGEGTHGVAITPDGDEVWIANRVSNDVVVLDAASYEPLARLSAGAYANHLTFTPDGSMALVSNARANELMVFDVATRDLLATIPVGGEPHEIAVGRAVHAEPDSAPADPEAATTQDSGVPADRR